MATSTGHGRESSEAQAQIHAEAWGEAKLTHTVAGQLRRSSPGDGTAFGSYFKHASVLFVKYTPQTPNPKP